jgi:hypothetical protein
MVHPKQAAKAKARSRHDVHFWNRFMSWVKVNERMIMVILLMLVAPAFAFTGPTTSFFDKLGGNTPWAKANGRTYYSHDFQNVQEVIASGNQIRLAERFSGEGDGPMQFLLLEQEADRLRLDVSDDELAQAIRRFYWQVRVLEERALKQMAKAAGPDGAGAAFDVEARFKELASANAWDARDWQRLLRDWDSGTSIVRRMLGYRHVPLNHRVLENNLRRYMRVEKVQDYVYDSVQVSEAEVYDEFLRREQLRKASFFEVKIDDEIKKRAAEGITDADLDHYFEANRDSFESYFPKLGFEYAFIPFDHFLDQVQLTDEEIQKEYESSRDLKYRRGLAAVGTESFDLVSPEEEAARRKELYKPLEEVREEVVKDLKERKKRELAEAFAAELKKRFLPAAPAAGEAPPEPIALEALRAELPFVAAERTPLMSSFESREKLGKAASQRVSNLFQNLDANSRETDSSKRRAIVLPDAATENTERSGLVLYRNLKTRDRGIPERAEATDEIREKLIEQRALDLLRSRVEPLVVDLREGKTSFEQAVAAAGAKARATGFVKRGDTINLPAEKAEAKPDQSTAAAEPPKMEPFKGGRILGDKLFALEAKGDQGAALARDDSNGAFYVVRLDETLEPNPEDFPKSHDRYFQELSSYRKIHRYLQWTKDLWGRADVASWSLRGSREG